MTQRTILRGLDQIAQALRMTEPDVEALLDKHPDLPLAEILGQPMTTVNYLERWVERQVDRTMEMEAAAGLGHTLAQLGGDETAGVM